MRVALLPTGMMELHGLRDCLARLFPEHELIAVPRVPARPGVAAEPFSQSFTARHDPASTTDAPKNLLKLVQELAGQVYPRRRHAVDLAVVVDDLELCNLDQPEVIIDAVRDTVRGHVERAAVRPEERAELARCLRERVSFHLAVPMTEAFAPLTARKRGVSAAVLRNV